MKLDNYCILCTDQKNVHSNSIKVWLTLFKNLDLTDKLYLKNPNKNMASANLSIYRTWKTLNQNKKTINLRFLHYSNADIQDYFEFIIKKHETLTENPPIQTYPNKIKNSIVFKIKSGYKLKLLTPELKRLLGSTKKRCLFR